MDSGGWHTVTTKARINEYSPARVSSVKGKWLMGDGSLFYDGMVVNADGAPLDPRVPEESDKALGRRLDRMIHTYINRFVESVVKTGLKAPGSGDCWACYFRKVDKDTVISLKSLNPLGFDHIFSHFEEKYYVPSLLWSAVCLDAATRRRDPLADWNRLLMQTQIGSGHGIHRMLKAYFAKMRPNLLDVLKRQTAASIAPVA